MEGLGKGYAGVGAWVFSGGLIGPIHVHARIYKRARVNKGNKGIRVRVRYT